MKVDLKEIYAGVLGNLAYEAGKQATLAVLPFILTGLVSLAGQPIPRACIVLSGAWTASGIVAIVWFQGHQAP